MRFLGGKGGVGKTTLAAATALLESGRGLRTLVVSTDPAHSLGDVLAADLGDEPRQLPGGLWAAELSGQAQARRRVEQVAQDAADAVPREVLPAVRRHLDRAADSPGTIESALFDRLSELIEQVPRRWDRLVVDSAPTGHMLRLLSLPELLRPWIEGLARQRERARGADRMLAGMLGRHDDEPDPLLARLHQRRDRMQRLHDRLRSDTEVHLVLVAERLAWAETVRTADSLTEAGMRLGAPVVNRVVPSGESGLLAARRAQQDAVLAQVRGRFGADTVVEVPLLAAELVGTAELNELVELLDRAGW